jgi:probable addiction module antidote protein
MSKKPYGYWDDYLFERLRDPEEAAAYLNAAMEEGDMPDVFLIALRNVAKANGITNLSRETGITRAGLYRTLSRSGNPGIRSLRALFEALGISMHFISSDSASVLVRTQKAKNAHGTLQARRAS